MVLSEEATDHTSSAPPRIPQAQREFETPLRAQRIDPVNEIFLVQRSHAGQHIPIHCQVKTFTTNCNTVCEDPLCITAAEENAGRGIFSYQCEHTISTHYSQLIPNVPQFNLQQCLTSELMTTGKKSRLSKLNENFPNIPLIVVYEFKEDMLTNVDRYLYFSVLEPGPTSYYNKLARVLVTIDTKKSVVFCKCRRGRKDCFHSSLALFYAKQLLPRNPLLVELQDVTDDAEQDTVTSADDEEVQSLEKMLQYQLRTKIIPPEHFAGTISSIPAEVRPSETTCDSCGSLLLPPELTERNAILYTMKEVHTNIKVYVARCPSCKTCYRYALNGFKAPSQIPPLVFKKLVFKKLVFDYKLYLNYNL